MKKERLKQLADLLDMTEEELEAYLEEFAGSREKAALAAGVRYKIAAADAWPASVVPREPRGLRAAWAAFFRALNGAEASERADIIDDIQAYIKRLEDNNAAHRHGT